MRRNIKDFWEKLFNPPDYTWSFREKEMYLDVRYRLVELIEAGRLGKMDWEFDDQRQKIHFRTKRPRGERDEKK